MSSFRFLCFGSGSSGNCFYYETPQGAFLIDAGIGVRKLMKYFTDYGLSIANVKAMFLTHDHIDHVRCASLLSNKYGIPMYATEGVWAGIMANPVIRKKDDGSKRHILQLHTPVGCCGCVLEAFSVPHDSVENVGYYITYTHPEHDAEVRLAHVTDVGQSTTEIQNYIAKANYLILESNYDEAMLQAGPYPPYLKRRIKSGFGHLSNSQSAAIVVDHVPHLEHVWLCHLSENNNTPEKALSTMQTYLASRAAQLQESGISDEAQLPVEALRRTSPSGFFDIL